MFDQHLGMHVGQQELPMVVFADVPGHKAFYASDRAVNEGQGNIIVVSGLNDLADGVVTGEEMAHFYRERERDRPDRRDKRVDEFFGFLGRRLLYKVLDEEGDEGKDVLFPTGYPQTEGNIADRELLLEKLQKIHRQLGGLRGLQKIFAGDTMKDEDKEIAAKFVAIYKEKILAIAKKNAEEAGGSKEPGLIRNATRQVVQDVIDEKKHKWKKLSSHHRGYTYAEKIDVDRIKNWPKLFAMSDKEVKQRFLQRKGEPDYSGLEEEPEPQDFKLPRAA
jgi:hypothetical protein